MTVSVLSNYAGNLALSTILKGPCWLAAHESDPTVTGQSDTEVAGGGYVRQPISFSVSSGKSAISTNKQRFPGMPECIVWGFAVWDSPSGGHLIFTIYFVDEDGNPAPVPVAASAALDSAAGDIGISL